MKKSFIVLAALLMTQVVHASKWTDFRDQLANDIKKGVLGADTVNCFANYSVSEGTPLGRRDSKRQEKIQAGSVLEGCQAAKSSVYSKKGLFGPESKQIDSLVCTNRKGESFNVNLVTCQK